MFKAEPVESGSADSFVQNEEELKKQLEASSWDSIPSLNYGDLDEFKEGQLVKFSGMVQDMRSPEYYLDSYESYDKVSRVKTTKTGKFREFLSYNDNEEIGNEVRKELQTFYVISTPGENEWVKELKSVRNEDSCEHRVEKRCMDEEMETEVLETTTSDSKRVCVETENRNIENESSAYSCVSKEFLMNFPLKNESGKGSLVKLYENFDQVKLNEIYEFVGFLCCDPKLCRINETQNIEDRVMNPPPSLIPRLHCISFRKLKFSNPLIENFDNAHINIDNEMFVRTRKELMILLTQLCLGDEIAAEYLLFNLISEIYVRSEVMALGKFTLNLSNIPTTLDFGKKLNEILEMILCKNHYFELSIENLNHSDFVPKKDYETNRLNSALLQLTKNTNLLLDETKLEVGKLEASGVKAVQTLANLIQTQKVSYDFNFYPLEFECDIPILILSEGKSMLPSDFHVVLKPEQVHLETFNEIVEAAKQFLRRPDLLNDIRKYLTLCRFVNYEISDDSHGLIEETFVEMRSKGGNSNDLHDFLVLNRLICMSFGKSKLDKDTCELALKLETSRKGRKV